MPELGTLGSVRGVASNGHPYRDKARKSRGPSRWETSKATCAVPSSKGLSLCRGQRPHPARKDRVGTWETSSGPQSRAAIPGRGRKARSRSCRGTGEGSDEPRSTDEAPEQTREERRRRARREGGSVGGMADDWRCSGHRTGQSIPCLSPTSGSAIRGGVRVLPDHARPPAGARCGKAARRDLCGGQGAIPVPTATGISRPK